ncbi:LacI family transcriptional regulator [Flavobacterium noncentrifugens]|uniref:Transcriptional regulator, LacI family n=1 Tax=Flavobacterium noncentrifugens TaxID=1128970 RepID=A0A1G8RXD2_9FLAO|nr:LacI family DNA-binding transcriptional regulator [Flavobacterium noncentrifugens]GEP49620.1 LacI family transcriptional regulator [Flavobacterium noncentrifugens]SDJ21607.1 transcriptional regulator, LacI family [Flavobacterium noncentrifugens]
MNDTKLIDIAAALGISVTTVSKALKGYSDISKTTRSRVLEMADTMNYRPNANAVNLRTNETKTIGVIIPATVHHFFSSVLNGILEEAENRGYLVIILQSNEKYELEKKQIALLLQKRVDGILISLSNETDDFSHINAAIKNNTPVVLFDKIAKMVDCSKVVINDRKAAYDAVTYLIEKGYKKIAHFRGSYVPQNSIDRFLGYKKALEDRGIAYDPSLVYMCDHNSDFEDGYVCAKKLVEDHKDVDAVFAITDLVAIGIIKYLNEINIKIPDQIAVFGFSNWFMSTVISPKLTTIDQPGYEIGHRAASILIDEIAQIKEHLPVTHQIVELPTHIIERESTLKTVEVPA